ncbi:unnamed protein product [Parnassius mnemosyne]|uniref:Uncharacterized protein n=1 Tax=Parnassius mnemosyne TaxID=213953 RepID=A0AAV1LGL6_9NEOP
MLEVRSIRQQQNIQVVHGNCSAYQYNPDNKHSEHKYIQIAKPKNRWTELKDFDNINWERLIDIPESLQLIKDLLLRYHPVWTNFLNIKRRYNTIFQMTSFGANTVREEDCNEVDDMNDRLVETVHAVRAKFCKTRRRRTQKLSDQKQKQKQKLFYSI